MVVVVVVAVVVVVVCVVAAPSSPSGLPPRASPESAVAKVVVGASLRIKIKMVLYILMNATFGGPHP